MKKILAVIMVMGVLLSLTACGGGKYAGNGTGNSVNGSSTNIEAEKPSCIGDWIWVIDEEYAIVSISKTEIKVISSAGYGEILKLEYEDSTGYGYADLSSVDLPKNACIIPINSTQCIVSPSVESDDISDFINKDSDVETFSTSKGNFYKFGIPLFKKDKNTDKFAGIWKVTEDTYYNGEFINQEFEITDRYFYNNKYSFISLGEASVIMLKNKDSGFIETSFYVETKDKEIYLYETQILSYFGNNYDNINEFTVGKNKLLYDKAKYSKLTKTDDCVSCYIENIPVDDRTTHSGVIKGTWAAFGNHKEVTFYSDGSISDSDDDEIIGEWSIVDEKLKISKYEYYGTETEMYDYKFIDSNTLILYHIKATEITDVVIYVRLSL